jgi:hypothetical protein
MLQYFVAGSVSMGVVDLLEAVQIQPTPATPTASSNAGAMNSSHISPVGANHAITSGYATITVCPFVGRAAYCNAAIDTLCVWSAVL